MEEKETNKLFDLIINLVIYKTPNNKIYEVINLATRNLTNLKIKICILDNFGDISLKKLSENQGYEYYFIKRNIGFGAGHNYLVGKTANQTDNYLFLNPDVYINSQDLYPILDYFSSNNQYGILSPKLNYPDGSPQHICRIFPNVKELIFRFFSKSKSSRTIFDYDSIMQVPFIHGACFFIKYSVFKEVGGFDERFFLYMEDMDLCRKINENYKVVYFPKVSAIHEHQKGSSKEIKLFIIHVFSVFKYFNKWGWVSNSETKRINNSINFL